MTTTACPSLGRSPSRVRVIAEIGVNHDGYVADAIGLAIAAKYVGADAVKIQLFTPSEVTSDTAEREMLNRLCLTEFEARMLISESPLPVLASVFDAASVQAAVALGMSEIKLGSGEIDNLPLHAAVRATGLPVILSCGMATRDEVCCVVEYYQDARTPLTLMHCVSAYPTPDDEANVATIPYLRALTGLEVGYSDHTLSAQSAVMAVALGARVIERHLTFDRQAAGPDHAASSTPDEFAAYVTAIRAAERALGSADKTVGPAEMPTRARARRSIYLRRAVEAGDVLAEDALVCLRPNGGMSPWAWPAVLGRRAARALPAGHRLAEEDLCAG